MPERRARSGRAPRRAAGRRAAPRRGTMAGPVRILFLDVDGTLTDGIIGFDRIGDHRHFWVRDGLALEWARDLGVLPVVISGRASAAVEARMNDLRLEHYLGAKDKVAVAERVLAREGVEWRQCAMVGDDLPDVPMLRRVGWPIAVADASGQVREVAKTVTRARGGFGAVREAVEMILAHNGTWNDILKRYEAMP
jgi:3-deoxy-D-manno-octulosonate 8-phosphate phosphatase (KDO 8-P phosphatase)